MLYTADLGNFSSASRKWQGIPGIEISCGGRLFVVFYSGGATEQLGNYCVLIKSDDNGKSWSEPVAAAYESEDARAYDPCIWIDPLGRLWFFWSVMPSQKVWFSICCDPDSDILSWSEPKSLFGEIMLNKPTVLKSGDWLFPVAVWNKNVYVLKECETASAVRGSFVWRTRDCGSTFEPLGYADVPDRSFDEHMILELNDGSLLMLVRTFYGIGKSYSYDGGITWTPGENSGLGGPCSRFFIRRLASGNILLINHHDFDGRNNLKAMISRDDGLTWEGYLMIDERNDVSYPDAAQDKNGRIHIVYDRERYGAKEILCADITEEDILAGRLQDRSSRLRITASRLDPAE